MSLIKIPLILLTAWGFNISITSPNPPPPKDEYITTKLPLTENADVVRWTLLYVRTLQLFITTSEIATILASASPSSPISKVVLSLLVWNDGNPANLCISNAAKVGFIVFMLGTWIRLMTYRHLGRFFRFEASIQKDHELIVSGLYSVVRHPSYTGIILVHGGWLFWHLSKGSWIMESGLWDTTLGRMVVILYIGMFICGTTFGILRRAPREDAALRIRFGTEWDDWAKAVPYRIFPGIY